MLNLHALLECYNTYGHDSIYYEVAGMMLQNYNRLNLHSLQKFADSIHVSPATVNRFLKQLGYRNFTVFRGSYLQGKAEYQSAYQYVPAPVPQAFGLSAYGQLLSQSITANATQQAEAVLRTMAAQMLAHKEIVFIGVPMVSSAWRLQMELVLQCRASSAYIDPNYQMEALQNAGPQTMVVTLQYLALEGVFYHEAYNTAKARGAYFAQITNGQINPALAADLSLCYQGSNTNMDSLLLDMYLNYLGMLLHSLA